jgi:WD40 repeat protein
MIGDQFGISVAISGNTAIVGARLDDSTTTNEGSAYLFDVTTGTQLFKLTADDAEAGDEFGISVAISGNTAIVGASMENAGGADAGAAYLFDVSTGDQLFKLTASDAAAGDRFGVSVGISGSTAIVGSYWDDDAPGGTNSGSAYLFDVTTGNQLHKLTANDAAEHEYFGFSVAISGNTAIVGAYWDDFAVTRAGAAYLFEVSTGNQLYKLTADDAAAGDIFGYAVAVSGNTAIVAARFDDDGGSASGSAYLFDVNTGNQLDKLTANDAAAFDNFGYCVAIDEGVCIVGSPADDDSGDGSGSAYLFEGPANPPTSVPPYVTIPLVVRPNPFRSETTINFDLPALSFVRLVVFDVRGRRVRTLLRELQPAGTRAVNWDGYTDGGQRAPSGVYFARLETAGNTTRTRKILLTR